MRSDVMMGVCRGTVTVDVIVIEYEDDGETQDVVDDDDESRKTSQGRVVDPLYTTVGHPLHGLRKNVQRSWTKDKGTGTTLAGASVCVCVCKRNEK